MDYKLYTSPMMIEKFTLTVDTFDPTNKLTCFYAFLAETLVLQGVQQKLYFGYPGTLKLFVGQHP